MNVSVQRSLRERIGLFVFVCVAMALLVVGFVGLRVSHSGVSSPLAWMALPIGLLAAWMVDRRVGASIVALRTARLGSHSERLALLEESDEPTPARAFVAVEAGELERAERIVQGIRAEKRNTPEEVLATMRYDLARASGAKRDVMVDAILDWDPAVGGLHGRELQRYRAFVLASMFANDRHSQKPIALAEKLFASGDEQVCAYASWLVLEDETQRRATACPNGAALARHHGLEDLARTLEAQSARLAAGIAPTPHRS